MQTTALSLLHRVKNHQDDASWQRLEELYRPLILGWLRRDPQLRDEAEDLVQDVMATLVRELPQFERQRNGSFRKWLRTVTYHRLQWHWREKKKRSPGISPSMFAELEDAESNLSKKWDEEHDQHVLRHLFQTLKEEFEASSWMAFQQVVLADRKAADVADDLGISVNAVLLAKSRILKRLREEAKGLID